MTVPEALMNSGRTTPAVIDVVADDPPQFETAEMDARIGSLERAFFTEYISGPKRRYRQNEQEREHLTCHRLRLWVRIAIPHGGSVSRTSGCSTEPAAARRGKNLIMIVISELVTVAMIWAAAPLVPEPGVLILGQATTAGGRTGGRAAIAGITLKNRY